LRGNGKFVVLENLEEVARVVAAKMEAEGLRGRADRILSKSLFTERVRDVLGEGRSLGEKDADLLLRFLERDKGVLVSDGVTVKVMAPGEKLPSVITNEDATIASLKTLIRDLGMQTKVLENRVDELGFTAKEAVVKKNRVAALAALRSKKLAETTLSKRHATLGQLEDVFAKIEQASDQVDLVRVMEGSTKVLSGLNKEVGGVEKVDDVVDQLREQMSQVDEVGNVIAEVGQESGAVGDSEVDDELEAMEREEREKKEALEGEGKERKEAEETKKKLDALSEIGRQAKENSKEHEPGTEMDIEQSMDNLKRLSLDPDQLLA